MGFGAFWFTGIVDMLLKGSNSVNSANPDSRLVSVILIINVYILFILMINIYRGKFEVFLKLIIFSLSLILFVGMATAGAVAGVWAVAVALAGDVAVAVAIMIINFFLISILIAYRIHQEDPQFSYLRTFGLQLATFLGTCFNRANLTDANFHEADLKHVDFADATLIRTNFRDTQNLKYAYVKNTILEQKTVRELLVHGKTDEIDFKQKDLHGAYLVDANLQNIDFTDANFIEADLSGADLRGANLTRIQAIGTRFSNADLTGACLEAWNIDQTTDIEHVRADYVYLKNNQQERRPSSGIFSDGEFSKLFQEVLDTVDLIFKKGEFNIEPI